MGDLPYAIVKDLRSSGYFFDELRGYSDSNEIELSSFSRTFAVPYLTRKSESYDKSGQANKSNILNLAVEYLSNVPDEQMVDAIFGLKKVAETELEANQKSLHGNDQLDKSERRYYRQKSEAAESLGKLLVSMIRMFKLVEVITKRSKSEEACVSVSVVDTIKDHWKLSPAANV